MIEIEHLSKTFGTVKAVQDLSLFIPKGELFCFLGPNGAGKTTTIKMLCGLLRPSSGTIRIAGIDLQKHPEPPRRFIGYIPDSPFLYERLTPTEFFEFIGDLYQIPRAETDRERKDSFHLFGLEEHSQTLIKDMSHGLRQRLIYSATFLHKPEVLFIDEPFVGLDPFTIRMIRNLLHQKAQAGMTIFMTTHILALVENIAERIGIISHGRLVALGTIEALRVQSSVQGSLEDIFLSLTSTDK